MIGKFGGKENAFLIQNAFPIVEKYIDHVHTIQEKPITVHNELNKLLTEYLREVLAMQNRGIKLLFTNVEEIKRLMEMEK